MSDESPLKFPCEFDIKAFGKAEEGFVEHVAALVRRYAPGLEEANISVRESRQGRYLSVTLTIRATSKEQLEAIAFDLREDPRVLASF